MIDRNAIHKLVDRVVNELEEGENFINFEICSSCISLSAKRGNYTPEKPYAVNISLWSHHRFTMSDAEDLIRRLDQMETDTNQDD